MNNENLKDKEDYFIHLLSNDSNEYIALEQVRSQYSQTYSEKEAKKATAEQLINFYRNNILGNDANTFRENNMKNVIENYDNFAKTMPIIKQNFLATYINLKITGIEEERFLKNVLQFYYTNVSHSKTMSVEEWSKEFINFTNSMDENENIKYIKNKGHNKKDDDIRLHNVFASKQKDNTLPFETALNLTIMHAYTEKYGEDEYQRQLKIFNQNQENEIKINNHNDYERIKSFARTLTEKQLLEIQGILIEAENNPKYLSDVVSAFDDALKEKHNENKEYKEDKVYVYKGSEYNIPDELMTTIYQDRKLEYQLDFLNELKNDKEFSYLKTLTKDELIEIAQRSKEYEEEWAVNDNLPTEAVKKTIERHKEIKKEELYDKYRSYTNSPAELSRTALELEKKPNIDTQIIYLKNKIANFEREPQAPAETHNLKL